LESSERGISEDASRGGRLASEIYMVCAYSNVFILIKMVLEKASILESGLKCDLNSRVKQTLDRDESMYITKKLKKDHRRET
jgi:hypothetical protein